MRMCDGMSSLPSELMAEVIGIFRHEALEKLFQVAARARIGIFHDDDAATGVLNKNGDGPIPDAAFIDLRLHGIGDFVETFAIGADFEFARDGHAFRGHVIACMTMRAKQGAAVSSPPSFASAVWRPPFLDHDRALIFSR